MIYCFNLRCPQPQNPESGRFCQACGWPLRWGDRYQASQPARRSPQGSYVWLGWDTQSIIQPRCDIKATPAVGATPWAQETAMEELRQLAARLGTIGAHPQLPLFYAYYERDLTLYFVQSHLEGETAAQRLQQRGVFEAEALLEFLISSLTALQVLHDQQILHRDIQPAHLLQVPGRPDWCLTGLESAKGVVAEARPGTRIGSAEYAAPEQLQGQSTPASDIYSLGVTAIHLLTRLSPFDLFDPVMGDWLWRSVAVDVDDRLATILDRMIAVDLRDRYPTVAAVQADLAPWGSPAPHSAPPPVAWAVATSTWHLAQIVSPPADLMPPVQAFACSPQGDRLAIAASDPHIYLWQTQPFGLERQLTGHEDRVLAIAFSPDGATLVSGSGDRTLRLWFLTDPKMLPQMAQCPAAVTAIAIGAEGQTLLSSGHDRQWGEWSMPSLQLQHRSWSHPDPITAIAISPDQRLVASTDTAGRIHLGDRTARQHWRTLPQRPGRVAAIAWADANTLISAHWDLTVLVRNAHTGGIRHTLRGHSLPVQALALDHDHQEVITASLDGTVGIWDLATGQNVQQLTGLQASLVAIAVAGQTLVGVNASGSLYQWQRR